MKSSSSTDSSPARSTRSKRGPPATDDNNTKRHINYLQDTQSTQETTSAKPLILPDAKKNIQFWTTKVFNYVQYRRYVESFSHKYHAPDKTEISVRLQDYIKDDHVVLEVQNASMSRKDFIRLASSGGEGWLSDQIMKMYGEFCIMARNAHVNAHVNKQRQISAFPIKNWFIVNSYTFEAVLCDKHPDGKKRGKYNVNEANKQLLKKLNFNDYCGLLIPYHHKSAHWTLIKVDFEKNQIIYLDSLQSSMRKYEDFVQVRLEAVRSYLTNRMKKLPHMTPRICEDAWDLSISKNVSRQHNTYDCGVFTLMFADFITLGFPIDDLTELSESYRKMILIQLWNLLKVETEGNQKNWW